MKSSFRVLFFALLTAMLSLTSYSSDEELTTVKQDAVFGQDSYQAAFARLKRLEGTWNEAEYGRVIEYRLTGRGSALIEEFLGDPPMSSVYHLDGSSLRLTHYCNAGNQPRMQAVSYEGNFLEFDFVDVTNLKTPNAYHTRKLAIEFLDNDHVILDFVGMKDGEKIATTHTLSRLHSSETQR